MKPILLISNIINFNNMHIIAKYVTALVTATGMIGDLGVKNQNLELLFYNDVRVQFIIVFFFLFGIFNNIYHSLIISIIWFIIKYYKIDDNKLESNKKSSQN